MNLKQYIQAKRGNATDLAAKLDVSLSTLSQLAAGANITPQRAVLIEKYTNYAVTRPELRPHDWADIWPELQVAA